MALYKATFIVSKETTKNSVQQVQHRGIIDDKTSIFHFYVFHQLKLIVNVLVSKSET